jgi:hypothetical protein
MTLGTPPEASKAQVPVPGAGMRAEIQQKSGSSAHKRSLLLRTSTTWWRRCRPSTGNRKGVDAFARGRQL